MKSQAEMKKTEKKRKKKLNPVDNARHRRKKRCENKVKYNDVHLTMSLYAE